MAREEIWKPHLTVAAVIEEEGRFLLVEERENGRLVYNQPAGHVEDGESLVEAVVRETLEETAYRFSPCGLTGLYLWRHPETAETFVRVAFYGSVARARVDRPLDPDIVRTVWLDRQEIAARARQLRSPLVPRALEDYVHGRHHPLDVIREYEPR